METALPLELLAIDNVNEEIRHNEEEIQSVSSYLEPLRTPPYLELLETDHFNEGILRKEEGTGSYMIYFLLLLYIFCYVYMLVHIQSLV